MQKFGRDLAVGEAEDISIFGRRIANPGAAAALDAWNDAEDENHG